MVEIIGHRGSSREAPENTLASSRLAFSEQADGVEVDVRMTKDGELVCIHDKNTLRTTGVAALIKEKTLAELKSLDAGQWKGEQWKGETIPSLQEILDTIPQGKKIFIEMKEGPHTIDPLIRCIETSNLNTTQISVASFHQEVVRKMKQEMEKITTNLLVAFESHENNSDEEVLHKLLDSNLDGVGAQNHSKLSPVFVNKILEAGKKVHVWTVDNVDEAKNYKAIGLSSITTNVPGLIKSYL